MKRSLQFIVFLSILLFGCNIAGAVTPTAIVGSPTSSATLPFAETTAVPITATATEVPPPIDAPAPAANVVCNELSLYLDPALATGFACNTVAEAAGPDDPAFGINPQYSQVTLQGYVLPDTFHQPQISVFPVQRFRELLPDQVNLRVGALQGLISGGAPGGTLPLLPIFNAAQNFYAQYQVVAFTGGSGIRYLSQYNQYAAPINNRDMFYSFQGMTADGAYWISVILPASNPILPANADNPPDGMSWDDLSSGYDAYLAGLLPQLNAQAPGAFSPDLTVLDTLVAGIRIQP